MTIQQHVYTITRKDVGKRFLKINNRRVMTSDFMGSPQTKDIGKRIYEKDKILSIENDEQLNNRVANS